MLIAILAVAGCRPVPMPIDAGPPTVTVSQPVRKSVVDYAYFTGRTEAVEAVEIRARVSGYLDKVFFREGHEVKKDQPLFEIDRRQYQNSVDQAKAAVERAKAEVTTARAEYARQKKLLESNATSRADYDTALGKAGVADATLAQSKAQLAQAELNYEFSLVASPIDGRISRVEVTPGNLIVADQTLLTTIVSVAPMYVYFDVDERTVLQVQAEMRERGRKPDEDPDLPIDMALATDEGFPHQGKIDFVDNRIDTGTGTLSVRGVLPNDDRLLTAGLFCRVRVPLGPPHGAILVPERALGTDQGQKYVLTVDRDNVVQYRPVQIGSLEGTMRVISSGLDASDRVIVEGQIRVRPGSKVVAELAAAPTAMQAGGDASGLAATTRLPRAGRP